MTQRTDGRWMARLNLGIDDLGRRQRRTLYGATQAEVLGKLRAAQREARRKARAAGAPKTVGEWLDAWLVTVRQTRAPGTYASYESACRCSIKPALGRRRLADLTTEDVERFLAALLRAGMAPGSVYRTRSILSTALGRAVRRRYLAENVAASRQIELPSRAASPSAILTLPEARRFLASARSDRLHALYLAAVVLGPRQSELLGLCWDDVDFEAGRLRMQWRLGRVDGEWQLRRAEGTKRGCHTLPLLAPVADALREHQARQQTEREIAGSAWRTMEHGGRDVDLVFTGRTGMPLHGPSVTRSFRQRLEEAGLPRMRFHGLRHSAASVMLALGVPLKTVSEVLDHSSIRITADTYGHLVESVVREHLEPVAAAWAAAGPKEGAG